MGKIDRSWNCRCDRACGRVACRDFVNYRCYVLRGLRVTCSRRRTCYRTARRLRRCASWHPRSGRNARYSWRRPLRRNVPRIRRAALRACGTNFSPWCLFVPAIRCRPPFLSSRSLDGVGFEATAGRGGTRFVGARAFEERANARLLIGLEGAGSVRRAAGKEVFVERILAPLSRVIQCSNRRHLCRREVVEDAHHECRIDLPNQVHCCRHRPQPCHYHRAPMTRSRS